MERAAMTGHDLEAFLWYGYLPRFHGSPVVAENGGPRAGDRGSDPLPELVAAGAGIWKRVIESCLSRTTGETVVPLSGGLDSRAILAGLLQHMPASRIHTYTFGIPGTFDFDIGNSIAAVVGTRHCAFDLGRYAYSLDNLLDISRRVEGRTVLFQHVPVSMLQREYGGSGSVFWVGFMGDPLSGSHLSRYDSGTWEQAKAHFAVRNRFSQSIGLTPPGFHPEDHLPATSWLDPEDLCYDEQADFGVRQECYVRPLVLLNGFEYCTPFLHREWVDFMLSVPRRLREGQCLYKEILNASYPRLFSLPAKSRLGLPLSVSSWRHWLHKNMLRARTTLRGICPRARWRVSPGVKYIDFERGLRERQDLKTVVCESIQDLKKRRIVDWIDLDAIWNRHQNRHANHADALTLLASLEINFKTRDMGSE